MKRIVWLWEPFLVLQSISEPEIIYIDPEPRIERDTEWVVGINEGLKPFIQRLADKIIELLRGLFLFINQFERPFVQRLTYAAQPGETLVRGDDTPLARLSYYRLTSR